MQRARCPAWTHTPTAFLDETGTTALWLPPPALLRYAPQIGARETALTINIAVVTRESVILGCDSLSSASDWAFFPYRDGAQFAKDAQGNFILDASGNRVISIPHPQVEHVVTTVFGGARKMFCLYEDPDTQVAAITSGSATLVGETIADIARRFSRENQQESVTFNTVEEVANAFYAFARRIWETDVGYDTSEEELRPYLPTVQFLVGGIGRDDSTGQVFRLDIKSGTCQLQFQPTDPYGICWAGQSNFVERLLRGADEHMILTVGREIVRAQQDQRTAVLTGITEALTAAGVQIPEGLELNIEETTAPSIPWHTANASIDFANLPLQYAVEFASLLVNTQSGMQKFARGIPTVGGRTHVGVIQRGEKFRMLNEPELIHAHTGYSHDV